MWKLSRWFSHGTNTKNAHNMLCVLGGNDLEIIKINRNDITYNNFVNCKKGFNILYRLSCSDSYSLRYLTFIVGAEMKEC